MGLLKKYRTNEQEIEIEEGTTVNYKVSPKFNLKNIFKKGKLEVDKVNFNISLNHNFSENLDVKLQVNGEVINLANGRGKEDFKVGGEVNIKF